jgi:hypothetical protein
MPATDGSISFYFFDIDDNLLFLPTRLVGSGMFR